MSDPKDKALSIIKLLEDDHSGSYSRQRIPSVMDEQVSALVQQFDVAGPAERRRIWGMVSWELSGFFTCFAERMASLGVRERSRNRLREGLIALVIENHVADWRDNLTILSPLYHAAQKIDIDPDELFLEIAGRFHNSVAASIRQFAERVPADKSLEAFDYSESEDEDGFCYRSNFVLDKELFRRTGVDLD